MFINSKTSITENELKEIEEKFHFEFPKELKELYLIYNGGSLKKEIPDYAFSFLFPIKYGNYTLSDCIDDLQITEEIIPRNHIPFADDQGGNIFSICIDKEHDYGAIYYWKLDVGEQTSERISNSITSFFS